MMPMQPPVDPWLSRFAKLLVVATFCLIFLGGMVTSLGAGLSVPDWPTSYGYNMFTFPITRWVGGIRFEHTHRLLATVVGLLTSVLAAWTWRNWKALAIGLLISVLATGAAGIGLKHLPALAGPAHELTRGLIIMHVNIWSFAISFVILLLTTGRERSRHGAPWVQWLVFAAFLLVCVQGTLGGLRVTEVSIVLAMIHACTAQAFMCLTVAIATGLSPRWNTADAFPTRASRRGIPTVRALAWTLFGAIYCQLIVGAIMRHLHAGLAIPTFPLAFGMWIPPMLNGRVAIHFAHRVGALVVTLLTLALTTFIFTSARSHKRLTHSVLGLVGTVILQIGLGAYVIWSGRDPVITSLHVVNGAVVLGKALLLAMRATKLNTLMQPETAPWTHYQEAHA